MTSSGCRRWGDAETPSYVHRRMRVRRHQHLLGTAGPPDCRETTDRRTITRRYSSSLRSANTVVSDSDEYTRNVPRHTYSRNVQTLWRFDCTASSTYIRSPTSANNPSRTARRRGDAGESHGRSRAGGFARAAGVRALHAGPAQRLRNSPCAAIISSAPAPSQVGQPRRTCSAGHHLIQGLLPRPVGSSRPTRVASP